MTYQVLPVSKARHYRDFFNLPFSIYKHDPNWVAPFIPELKRTMNPILNPYFKHGSIQPFICYKNQMPVARVAVVINSIHQEKFATKSAFFGFFESHNDSTGVNKLFEIVESYCRDRRIEKIEGPFNPHHYSEVGIQSNQFGTLPTFFQSYNPSYYLDLLNENDFSILTRFQTWKVENVNQYLQNRFGNLGSKLIPSKYTVRSFNKRDLKNELEKMMEINNDAFSANWPFLPLSREEYRFSAKYLSMVTRPELIKIVELNGEPVGLLHCVLDINPLLKKMGGKAGPIKTIKFLRNKNKIKKIIIYTIGIKKQYQRTRVFMLILKAFCQLVRNYETVETTWISPSNTLAMQAASLLDAKPDKEFLIYEKKITS